MKHNYSPYELGYLAGQTAARRNGGTLDGRWHANELGLKGLDLEDFLEGFYYALDDLDYYDGDSRDRMNRDLE